VIVVTRRRAPPRFRALNPKLPIERLWDWYGSGNQLFDHADGQHALFGVGTGGTTGNYWCGTTDGPGILFDAAGTGTNASKRLLMQGGAPKTNNFTIFVRYTLTRGGGDRQMLYGSNQANNCIQFETRTSSGLIGLIASNVVVRASSTTSSASLLNRPADLACSYQDGVSRIYVNGVLEDEASGATTWERAPANGYAFGVDHNSGAHIENRSILHYAAVFTGALQPATVAAMSRGGFRDVVYAPRRMFFPVAAAPSGAPTLTDLQATNITSSSVQFTYDYAF
jgi:hypothetical protein